MSTPGTSARSIRSHRVVGATLVALLALLAGPSLRPALVDAHVTPDASSPVRPAHPEPPLLHHAAAPRTHASGTSPNLTASLSAHHLGTASAPPVGPVAVHRPGGSGDSPVQQPSSRGPPR